MHAPIARDFRSVLDRRDSPQHVPIVSSRDCPLHHLGDIPNPAGLLLVPKQLLTVIYS